MRAILMDQPGPPDVLHLADVTEPTPGEGELSIDVQYAGVGFVDTLFRRGDFPLTVPFTPGIEVAGRVRALGTGVTGFAVGQAVAALLNDFGRSRRAGGYAEVAVAHAAMAVPVPDGADLATVTAVLVNGVTGWISLHGLARLTTTDDVLVLGASGGLGGIVCRLAAQHPARRVIGVVGSERRRGQAAAECTDVVLSGELTAEVDRVTAGRGVDVVIDPVGGAARVEAFDRLAPFGRMVVLGNASGVDPALSGDAAWHGTRQLGGLSLGAVAHVIPEQVSAALGAVVRLVARDLLREPAPAVRPLEHAADVHRELETRSARAKTVLAVRPG